ncbi:YtxH domain-containing protein [Streptomyces sp. 8N706]|uniref:YtxH domain-containing protein n=1 Tax=Streptomyces sp. 8N706 TaxID=3457416 RepID=UPI003FD36595
MLHRLTFISGLAVGYVLGARAGRERYEQLRKAARQIAENPAVRNAAESAAQNGRAAASKAAGTVSSKVGHRLPESVTERVRAVRDQRRNGADDWGTSNT